MPVRTFDFCALQFLNQWLEKEAKICDSLASDARATQRDALVKAGGYFSIARNLPTKYEINKNLERYDPVLEVLASLPQVITPDNVEREIEKAQQAISTQYGGRKVLSLTTKFLWLKVKAPVRIYDNQARIALGTQDGDFSAFNAAFSARLAQCTPDIERACSKLKSVVSYTVIPKMSASEVDSLANMQWFKERVLDIYLWNQGNV
ncbi:MAG: hypothetical protein HGB33_06440 [Syntrophaceae bacterium]|nr:hypothetical protein [Syntrophaceae bacterium]